VVEYKCDWCEQRKKPGERWLVGLAAEKHSRFGQAREVTVALGWLEHWAGHPFAIHFCSPLHKDYYVARLLGLSPGSRSLRAKPVKSKVETSHSQVGERLENPYPDIVRKSAKFRRPRTPESPAPGHRTQLKFSRADHVRAHGMGVELGSPTPRRKAPSRQR
jgi:hypothetical protein